MRCSTNQEAYDTSSRRIASLLSRIAMRPSRPSLRDRMNRSMIAVARRLPLGSASLHAPKHLLNHLHRLVERDILCDHDLGLRAGNIGLNPECFTLLSTSRVEVWRGGDRTGELPLAGGFRLGAGVSVRSIAPFPHPAHRTGRADFPHPALRPASPTGTRDAGISPVSKVASGAPDDQSGL